MMKGVFKYFVGVECKTQCFLREEVSSLRDKTENTVSISSIRVKLQHK